MQLDVNHLRGWIGREETASEVVTPGLVSRFNATFDRTPSLDAGAEAPILIHFCLSQPVVPTAKLGFDGHPERGGFLPPVPLPRRMWAGGSIEFHDPIRIGDLVSRRSVINDVTVKEGRSGTLCFVSVMHHLESAGRAALTETQDIVHRAAPTGKTAPSSTQDSDPLPAGLKQRAVRMSAPFLFRYSALTFNAHRIHYDESYSRQDEGYPNLVVHGPLQATLLCQYAADLWGNAPKSFEFRSQSPLFASDEFTLNAMQVEEQLNLWTARPDGSVGMRATAQWQTG